MESILVWVTEWISVKNTVKLCELSQEWLGNEIVESLGDQRAKNGPNLCMVKETAQACKKGKKKRDKVECPCYETGMGWCG